MEIDYSRWLAAQEWLDDVERDARARYWASRLREQDRMMRMWEAITEGDNDD